MRIISELQSESYRDLRGIEDKLRAMDVKSLNVQISTNCKRITGVGELHPEILQIIVSIYCNTKEFCVQFIHRFSKTER